MKDTRTFLQRIADQLLTWASESRSGGWSTHQVEPQQNLAKEIQEHLTSADDLARWIPVTETMPEIGVPVIVHGILEGEHEHDRHEAFRRTIAAHEPWRSPRTENDENLRLREVTHWMPMPPAPNEGTAVSKKCPNDTDGDGNCHLCSKHGGCAAFTLRARDSVSAELEGTAGTPARPEPIESPNAHELGLRVIQTLLKQTQTAFERDEAKGFVFLCQAKKEIRKMIEAAAGTPARPPSPSLIAS